MKAFIRRVIGLGGLAWLVAVRSAVPNLPISAIQGAGHRSPWEGQRVTTQGVVTACRAGGFWIQGQTHDANPATSEGLYVHAGQPLTVTVGDLVDVTGIVQEYRAAPDELSVTEMTGPDLAVQTLSHANQLPAAVLIWPGGRLPPVEIIEDDAGNVESQGVFDPAQDGIDFYESLEGMRVAAPNATVVGPKDAAGIVVLPDQIPGAGPRTATGGLRQTSADANPERLPLGEALQKLPDDLNVGDRFGAMLEGVIHYEAGEYRLEATRPLTPQPGGLVSETLSLPRRAGQITLASLNLNNLDINPADGDDDAARIAGFGRLVVARLDAPDILALQEVQDDSGGLDNGVVFAWRTLDALTRSIQSAGGPVYQAIQIDPLDNADGGAPGGNIRQALLYRADRGLGFTPRYGGDALSPTQAQAGPDGPYLGFNPGRIDPANPAFTGSRKPLAAEFSFYGRRLFVIVVHFTAQTDHQPLFGLYQPPARPSQARRVEQAAAVQAFAGRLLALDPQAALAVLGDLNDETYSPALQTLAGGAPGLTNLLDGLPEADRYTYIERGNAQALDHILVSPALTSGAAADIVHLNADFAAPRRLSDHDPLAARLTLIEAFSQTWLPVIFR